MAPQLTGYRVVARLYASHRSIVDRAIRISDGASVIIKQPAEGVVATEGLRRLQLERARLDRLGIAGAGKAYDLIRVGSAAALVLEDLGDTLATRLAHGPLPLATAIAIGVEIARILRDVHATRMVHRDVNPNNLTYDPTTGAVRLIDFDLATSLGDSEQTACTTLSGTLHYLAPEQTGRLPRPVDARSDLYSFGITLHELISGRRPFDGHDALALVHAHLAEEPVRLDAVVPGLPAALADLVAKLTAKPPERRYQTAAGVLADLERCARALATTGTIAPFAVGGSDRSRRFEFPDRLYGRDPELRALRDAFDRAAIGPAETVLVSGYSGVGKTSLVRELYPHVAGRRGHIATGKFEQLHRDRPYGAIVAALDDLVAQWMADAGSEHALDALRPGLIAALGADAPLVSSLLPAIDHLLGPQPAPPVLEVETAHLRLSHAMLRLIQALAARPHPLVLFLDDMQWADAASLQLLTQLARSDDTTALLVVEAFRDNEVDPAHPFSSALRERARLGARLSLIAVRPLILAETTELIADALRCPAEAIADAAQVIWQKTEGNPLFVRRFLRALYDEGAIVFDPEVQAFTLDRAALHGAAVTDNVAELLARQLGQLPEATRESLVAAAVLGTHFDPATLGHVLERSASTLRDELAPAVAAGMLIALFTRDHDDEPRYRFQHDRILQAVVESAPSETRDRLHLRTGRLMLALATPRELHERLFEIVHHLGRGIARMTDDRERMRYVELAFEAAQRARRAGAFDVAATLLRSVCALRDWATQPGESFAAHHALAEVLQLGGAHDQARAVVIAAAARATERERATLAALEARICISVGQHAEALACTRRAAPALGVELPSDPAELARKIAAELAAVAAVMAVEPIERWIHRPRMTDPSRLAAMALLIDCIPAAYQVEPPLMTLISATLTTLSLRHGHCGASARGYASLAVALWAAGNLEDCYRFGKLGLDLVRRLGARAAAPSVEFTYAAFAAPWRLPLSESIDGMRRVMASGLTDDDPVHACYASLFMANARGLRGDPLLAQLDEARRAYKLCERLGYTEIATMLAWSIANTRIWSGEPPASGERDLRLAIPGVALPASPSMRAGVYLFELERAYWAGDLTHASAMTDQLEPLLETIPASPLVAEYRLYACLTRIARDGAAADVARHREELARYAAACPANYQHGRALVDAERAWAAGDVAGAIALFDEAAEAAATHELPKHEALIHTRVARFWLDRGKPAFAAIHFGKARDLCELWGAKPYARELERERRQFGASAHVPTSLHSTVSLASTLDFASVVKASHAIASDVVLDSLLGKMMDIIIESSGAQTGSIVLELDGALLVRASKRPGAPSSVDAGVALADAACVSEGIVKYTMRTGERTVLGDATRNPLFRGDPYVRTHHPRSVLCLPIARLDRVIGAIYLENNLIENAFTVDRLDALGILVAQLAISVENALMFSRLEELVAKRTEALLDANQRLREEAILRERMESELRLAQKLQSVGQLAAGVAHEINTPMQYIGDNLAFLDDTITTVFGLIDQYHRAIDPATGRANLAAMERADAEADLDYLRTHAPSACSRASDGIVRVSRIVMAMRAFSHPDQHEQVATSLSSAIENTLLVAHNEYRHVADVVTELADLPKVVCHAGEITQVLLNLVVNAAHAIEDVVNAGGPRGTITIRTRLDDDDTVAIEIADTGGGIPAAVRDRVFDQFFTTKEVGRGTGQGLALARTAIVERHGGKLSFETELGVGTTFLIRLPIQGRVQPAAQAS